MSTTRFQVVYLLQEESKVVGTATFEGTTNFR